MGDISLVLQMLMGGGGSFSAGGPGKGMHSRLCKLCPDLNFVDKLFLCFSARYQIFGLSLIDEHGSSCTLLLLLD